MTKTGIAVAQRPDDAAPLPEPLTNLADQQAWDEARRSRAGAQRATTVKGDIFNALTRILRSSKPLDKPASVDSICSAAGISTATFYKHFQHGLAELIFHFSLRLAQHIEKRVAYDTARLNAVTSDDWVTITVARMADVLSTYERIFSVTPFPDAAIEQLSRSLYTAYLSGQSGNISMTKRVAQVAAIHHTIGLVSLLRMQPGLDHHDVAEVLLTGAIQTKDRGKCLALLSQLRYDESKTGNRHLNKTPSKRILTTWEPISRKTAMVFDSKP